MGNPRFKRADEIIKIVITIFLCLSCFHLSFSSQTQNINELILKLKHKDLETRINAIKELEEIKAPQVVEALISALKDKNWEVRLSALRLISFF